MSYVDATELDALLSRVRDMRTNPAYPDRNAVAYDCYRMFEDLAARYREESTMRDRYKRQSNAWMNKAFEIDEIKATLLDAVKDALAFLDRPDITTYEWYKLAPEHIGKFRRAIAKAEGVDPANDKPTANTTSPEATPEEPLSAQEGTRNEQ